MIFLKSLAAGLAAVAIAAIVWSLAAVAAGFLRIATLMHTGSGGLGAISIELPELMLIGAFIVGFIWQFRRSRQRSRKTAGSV